MDSRKAVQKGISGFKIMIWAIFPVFSSILMISRVGFADTPGSNFQVTYPRTVHSGEAIKIHVRFSEPPPSHVFYQMEITIDGQPVAMADISEESSTWITAPAQKEGSHHLSVIWRNPPGGSPQTVQKDLTILPKSVSRSNHAAH